MEPITAGVPQGTKLGPWLFTIMINDLVIPTSDMWKFVDNSTLSGAIKKGDTSYIQNEVDQFTIQAKANKFQLNEGKCKELRIGCNRNTPQFDPILINNNPIEVVECVKLLGLYVSNNLKWNNHIHEIIKKARKRLFFLSKFKKSNIGITELVQFYTVCIRPILEYASPVFHDSLTAYIYQTVSK